MHEGRKRLQCRKKVALVDLLRPDCLPNEQIGLGVFAWMAETAAPYYQYGWSGPHDLLSMQPTVQGIRPDEVRPFGKDWKHDLWYRFHYAILSGYASWSAKKWRADHGIDINAVKILPMRVYIWDEGCWKGHPVPIWEDLDALFALEGKMLAVSPNKQWPKAKEISWVTLHIDGISRWRVRLRYRIPRDSSSWDLDFPSKPDEVFADFVVRAAAEIKALLKK